MKKILFCLVFSFAFLCFADNWKEIADYKVQTTIGYNSKGFQYICDWIVDSNGKLTLHVRAARNLVFGKYKTSCIMMEDYVFPSEAYEGFTENSIFLNFKQNKLKEFLASGEHEVMVKVAGYEFTTILNQEYGEFKD